MYIVYKNGRDDEVTGDGNLTNWGSNKTVRTKIKKVKSKHTETMQMRRRERCCDVV